MALELSSRERVLRLFRRETIDQVPVFSGMGNVTVHGLDGYGWKRKEPTQKKEVNSKEFTKGIWNLKA